MWCVPNLTDEFIERMEEVLDVYAMPYNPAEPVLCFDEKSKQLIKDTQLLQHTQQMKPRRRDYEYERNGTRNIFVTVEPKGGWRKATVTQHRKKPDFAKEIMHVVHLERYQKAQKIHIVLDNLNTHFETSFFETFSKTEAEEILKKIQFHYTPKHASWLNMAEIEIGVMSRQAIRGRIPTHEYLEKQLAAWEKKRNLQNAMINWTFTTKKARRKFKYKGSKLS